MFTKNSRYYQLEDIVVNNKNDRQIISKSMRQIPEVSGIFQHVIDDNDRLDLLASKFYEQPVKWWRICDANPEFKSPFDLLGKSSVKTYRYRLTDSTLSSPFPWLELINILDEQLGVVHYKIHDRLMGLEEEIVDWFGTDVTVNKEIYERFIDIKINTQLITTENISLLFAATSLDVLSPELLGRVGRKMIIPPVR